MALAYTKLIKFINKKAVVENSLITLLLSAHFYLLHCFFETLYLFASRLLFLY